MCCALPRALVSAAVLIAGMMANAAGEEAPIRFVSPTDGQVVRPGETIAVVLEVDPTLGATWAYVSGPYEEFGPRGPKEMTGPPFETSITIRRNFTGPTVLFGLAFLAKGAEHIGGAEVALMVVPADPPIRLVTMQDALHFRLSGAQPEPHRIAVIGEYADDVDLSLNDPALGTIFESSNAAVAVVSEQGDVRGVAPGMAVITVRNGAASAWVAVTVDDQADRRVTPVDQTANVAVSGSGFRRDPVTGLFTQQVTVVNRSQEPLVRPLVMVLDNLTPGVGVRSQVTRELSPVGTPWVSVDDDLGVLAPGASRTIEIQFENPQSLPIEYTPIIYSAMHPI
jgi:hypothetical protein